MGRDFLYQTEWQHALKHGALHRLDVAFSRDQAERIYVQQRMRERGAQLFSLARIGRLFVCVRRCHGDGAGRSCGIARYRRYHGGRGPEAAVAYSMG